MTIPYECEFREWLKQKTTGSNSIRDCMESGWTAAIEMMEARIKLLENKLNKVGCGHGLKRLRCRERKHWKAR